MASQITKYIGPEGTRNYSYDKTGQLLQVTDGSSNVLESYSFDVNGNRTMSGYAQESGTNTDSNRMSSDGTFNYQYDGEGNTISKTRVSNGEVTEFTWDYRNRLTKAVLKNSSGNILKEQINTYDAEDRRIGVSEDADGAGSGAAVQRWTVYDGANPYADFNGSGTLTNRYLYGSAMDELYARIGASGDVDFYLTDNLEPFLLTSTLCID